jgi:predicted amidohydrolase
MSDTLIALAHLGYPASPEHSVAAAERAIARAGAAGAAVVCFPECFVPGYRAAERARPAPDAIFLERSWSTVAAAAAKANVGVVLGTERLGSDGVVATALIVDRDGTRLGFQDKVQLDPSEDDLYVAGSERHVFAIGALTFGVVICHEGWRYPETVRWAVRRGAHVVFHQQFHPREPGGPASTFHENAVLCRAAENTCYFATVNYAGAGAPTTSAVARPDGTLLALQPREQEGLLVAEIDLEAATGLLAHRYKPLDL